MQIQIDEQFRTEIDPLTREERVALECSILEYGCRDALVVWGDTLIDGHNRYEICTEYEVPYRIVHMDFESRDHALLWINNNQDARRNQTPAQRIDRQLRKKEILERIGRSRMAAMGKVGGESRGLSMIDKPLLGEESEVDEVAPHNTQKQMAEAAGVSTGTIAMAEIAKRDAPEVWQMAKEGKASINESYKAAKLDPEDQAEVVRQVEDGESKTVSEAIKKVIHVTQNTGNNEWYTPAEFVEAARRVMGDFDLDPASSPIANQVVSAMNYYTEQDNGLLQEWAGRVWMNPPYERGLLDKFVEKLAMHIERGDVTEAVLCVHNATDTQWFARAHSVASAACFPTGRVKFYAPDGLQRTGSPLQGQCFLYFGKNSKRFFEEFEEFGCVFQTMRWE